jgi:hypothetical protein
MSDNHAVANTQQEEANASPASILAEANGGTWGEHPKFLVADWQHEVENNYTRSGYWEWVANKVDQDEDEEAEEQDD